MRVIIQHNKTQKQAKESIDRGFDQVFSGFAVGPVEFAEQHRQWHENTLMFSMTVKMGFIKTPVKGTIAVAEKDVTVDVDLGLFEKLVPQETVQNKIESSVKGLLT